MSVNLGHLAGHAHFFQVSIIVSEGREDIGIMDASLVDHFEEAFKRLQVDCACWLRNKGVANGTSKTVGLGKFWQDLEISKAFAWFAFTFFESRIF